MRHALLRVSLNRSGSSTAVDWRRQRMGWVLIDVTVPQCIGVLLESTISTITVRVVYLEEDEKAVQVIDATLADRGPRDAPPVAAVAAKKMEEKQRSGQYRKYHRIGFRFLHFDKNEPSGSKLQFYFLTGGVYCIGKTALSGRRDGRLFPDTNEINKQYNTLSTCPTC